MTEIKIDSLFFPLKNNFLWHVHLQHNPLPCGAQPVAEDQASHQVNGILVMFNLLGNHNADVIHTRSGKIVGVLTLIFLFL